MQTLDPQSIMIPNRPGAAPEPAEPLSLALTPALAGYRERTLAVHRTTVYALPELTLAEANAWRERVEGEDWLFWRARRCAARLAALPIAIEEGELIVGRPAWHAPAPEDQPQLEVATRVLAEVPPFPGGDTGHFHPDYAKLFRLGIRGLSGEINTLAGRPGLSASQVFFYEACRIALTGLSAFIGRVSECCLARADADAVHAGYWRRLATMIHRLSTEPPATFHEAIQLMLLTITALSCGEDHYMTTPGRMDQTLWPYYEADRAAGRLTREEAFQLICCLYVQLNRVVSPSLAVSVLVGGRDRAGRDVTNELTYLCLAARLATRLAYPTVAIAWHEGTPPELLDFATDMLAAGTGDPAFFNDEVIVRGLREHGVSVEDSFNYMNSTCVEIKPVGASNIWVTAPYINLPRALLEVMDGVARGQLADPETFEDLCGLVRRNLAATIGQAAHDLDAVWRARAGRGGFPLASCLIADCLARGLDFDRGGARYNWVENSFVGLANLVDSLAAVRRMVYEEHSCSLPQFQKILEDDFVGHEPLRQRIVNILPCYGNDDDAVDALAREWTAFLIRETEANTIGPHCYVPGFFCWIMHTMMGGETGATPDGRRAGWPLADGAGAAQGRERRGPTASILSTTGWPHHQAIGGLVHNAKFTRDALRSSSDRRALRSLIETYLRRGGFELQVNVVDRDTLLDAREHPERYPDLLVRVAGYSDLFAHLAPKMQEEIIMRTEFNHV